MVEDIKGQRARAARNGGAKGKVHAVDHIRNARHGAGRVGQVQRTQAAHQADKRAQDAQRGQDAGDHLAQLRVAMLVDYGIVVDVILHIAVHAAAVQLLGVDQKALPRRAHALAQEQRILPHGLGAILQRHHFQPVHSAAQCPRAGAANDCTLDKPRQAHGRDGAIYQ